MRVEKGDHLEARALAENRFRSSPTSQRVKGSVEGSPWNPPIWKGGEKDQK